MLTSCLSRLSPQRPWTCRTIHITLLQLLGCLSSCCACYSATLHLVGCSAFSSVQNLSQTTLLWFGNWRKITLIQVCRFNTLHIKFLYKTHSLSFPTANISTLAGKFIEFILIDTYLLLGQYFHFWTLLGFSVLRCQNRYSVFAFLGLGLGLVLLFSLNLTIGFGNQMTFILHDLHTL